MKRLLVPFAALVLAACSHSQPQPAPATPPPAPPPAPLAAAPAPPPGAPGDGPHARRGKRGGRLDYAKLLERFDANKDGKLQVTELPPRAQKRLGQADANGDGVIDENEIKAAIAARMKARFDRTDANHDGFITRDEAGKRWKRMQRADSDGDGKVSLAELQAAVGKRRR